MPNKVDYRTFSQRVKNKYPEYINMGDLELAQMWVSQNPQYREFVIFDQQPVKKKEQAAPSLGAQGGLPSQRPSAQPKRAKEERFFGGTFGDLLDALDTPGIGIPLSSLGIGDFIDDMGRAFFSGKKAGANISASKPLFFSGPGSSDEEVQNFVKAGTEYTAPSDEATQFYKDYEDSGKTTFGFVKALAKNPGIAPELVVQSASQLLFNPEAMTTLGTTITAGAGIGAFAGGVGAGPGAIASIPYGVAAANTTVSTLSSFSELMKQELDQRGLEFNEDNVRTILEDEKALRKIRAKSAGYGITIGAFDLATAKVGGAIAAKIPMTTRAGKIKSTLAITGAEAVGGSAGEAAARGVTGQELDPAEIGLEGIAEIPGAAPTMLSQVLKKPTYKINGEFVGQADVDDILQNSSRQELENTKFEVFNDVNMYGLKFRNRLEDLRLLEEITEANPNASEADINRLFELNSKLKKVEKLNSESAKASADWLRSQIREVQDGLLAQEFAPQEPTINLDVERIDQASPEAPQIAPAEVSPEVGIEIPQEDQGVLQVINSVVQPISSDIEARMNNAEEIPMSEIEAVVDALIDAQQSVRSQEGARTRQTQGGFVTEFGALSEDQKRNFDTLIEQQINKLLNYEFATITTTEQAGEKTKTAGLVATPREGRPLPESVVSRDRFDGAGVRVGGKGAGRITVKRLPGFGGRSVYGVSFGNRKGVAPVEDLEFDNLEFVAPEILADGSFNARVKDSKSGLEFTITDPELSIDLAIAAQLKEAGRKEFPQPAFLEAVREVTQGQPTQVTTFPNLGRTGTTPAAVGVEPQTEQDVRQETNAPQEGRGQGEDAAPVPQEEGRQEGQVTPPDVAQEGETPPAAKRTRKTEQQKADEGKAILNKLKETLRALKAKPGGGANIDLTFGVVPISKAVWNTAIDTAILAIDAGQSIAQAVKAASDYISSKIDGDWGKAKFEQYMDERFSKSSPKPKAVFHAGTLDGKGNIYVSPIREQANEYSSMSGAPVLEFEINENAMAPESEVRDLIRSLGLKLPEGYNLDELFLYEALDTRVKSSLSQGDIDKLYTALKDKGYEGIAFRDEDIRGVKREGIDNFIVFDKSSLSEQQAQPEVSEQGKGKSAEEIFNSSEIFEGQTPNQARLFFADALNDFKVPYLLGQPALDPRSDMTLTLNGAKFLLSENQRGPSNYVLIDDFLVNESLLGTGKGRDALVKLIEYADKNGITLVGEPLAMDGRRKSSRKGVGLSQKDLTDFYKRYGFTKISKESLSNVATAETGFFERKPQQQAQPEAKPAKTIAEQRKEFRETAKKYFDGLKKMGIAFDPEGNSKEDIAFLKALAKYIKLELDAGMVTFKGFIEKTANLVEDFKEASVVKAAKDVWSKEVVKAYPKLYAKYSAAKRKELEKEIKDIRKTMIRRIMDMTDPKIVNLKSQLKTEKRRLSKEAAAQLAAIRNAYDAKTMMAMEPEDLMELMKLTEGIYKEGRSEIKALNESLDEAAQIQGEEMLAAIASKDKRLEKLDSKEAASKMLAKKAGVVVAVKGDDRVIMKEEKDLEALDGEGYTFLFLNTTSDKAVDLGFLDSVVSFFSGKLRTINENARDLRTALELIKSRSKESQDFINGLVAKMNKASVTKARKSEEWSSILKRLRSDLFGPDIKFGYTNWMNAIAKVNGKPLKLINGRGVSIGPINNGKIVSLYRQIMDPTNLVKTDGVRKIDLSDESIQSIIDYMNLPGNLPGKEFALSLTNFFIKVAKDTKVVLENNGYNSTKLDEKRYNKEDFEGDDFIAKVMDQLAETRSDGFIPYTPIQATESPDTAQGVEIKEDDLFDSGDLQKNFSVISNNMITRKPGGVIVPTDIRQTLNAYTAGMANMNAKLPLLRETQSIFSNSNLKAMNNAFAPQFTENIKANYISFMTDRVTPVISNKTEAAMKTWLMTSTAIPMFLNFKSSILQMLASPNFMVSYDFSRYIDASKKLFGNADLFKDVFFEIINLPTLRQRFGSRFSPDSRIISEEMSRYGKVAVNIPFTNIRISAKELLSKGYIFSSIGDVVSIAIGGAPIYYDITQTNKKKYVAEGMSALEAETKAKQDAEEKLFEIIQETQQSSEAMYLSEFQKQSLTRIFSSFATATMQYYRKARRAATRMKNKEGNQLQNAYEILHYTVINAAVFQFFSSMLIDAVSGPGEDELEEMSREERMDFVRYMEDVMATVAQGTGGMGVALQATILGLKESQKSGKPEKIAESALRTMPAVRMKYDAAINAMREWKRGDYARSLTKGAELANIPADRIRSLGLQVSDALTENLDAQERIARLIGFRTESWMREKKQGEIWNGVQSAIDKSTPAERQRAISNTKSAYRDLFQLYGKRYAEATTEAEKARVDSIASKELLNVYNHRQGGPEFTKELQKLFNQSFEFNSLPKDMQKLKNMESNRKIGDIVEEVLSLEKKSEQKAMQYWSSLVNNGIISKNEIERIREEYNTRKGLQ